MNTPKPAAYSSPMQLPAFGAHGKYVDAKYVYEAKYIKPAIVSVKNNTPRYPIRNISRTDIDNKLKNLKNCYPLLPPNTDSTCALKVVPIHEHMDGEIQGYGNP